VLKKNLEENVCSEICLTLALRVRQEIAIKIHANHRRKFDSFTVQKDPFRMGL